MKLIERFRKRVEYHAAQADKWREIIALIESEFEPEIERHTTRKINGALRQHAGWGSARRKGIPGGKARMTMGPAILEALKDGPLAMPELQRKVEELRGIPTTRGSMTVMLGMLKKKKQTISGKAHKGIWGLPNQQSQLRAMEKTAPNPSTVAYRARRRSLTPE